MRFAVSNIALNAFSHAEELKALAPLGITGLEVAPSRAWRETWKGLSGGDVEAYRRQIDAAGLEAVGLHSLFYDQPGLGLFKDLETRSRTMDFLEHLSRICRDLGGKTLIYGGGRSRGDVSLEDAFSESISFFGELCPRIEAHGTCFCFEPLGPNDSDFVNSVYDSIRIVETLDHPALRVQLDAKALFANDEITADVFEAARPYLVHVHANEPNLGVLGSSEQIDHHAIGRHLREIGYEGYVSIEQKMTSPQVSLGDITLSARTLKECYG